MEDSFLKKIRGIEEKDMFLQRFKREENPSNFIAYEECKIIAYEIINILNSKELIYEELYATLELVYRELEYESNFITNTKFPEKFKEYRDTVRRIFSDKCLVAANEIKNLLKLKELTYHKAYEALNLVYNIAKYESNFIKFSK